MGKNLLATKCTIGCRKRGFDVPNLGKRVFPKKVLPIWAHPTEGFHRFRDFDVPILGKRVFLKKVLPIWAHPGVVPFFKLAGGGSDVIAKSNVKIKN
jgi:hypothetical protein